jgi:SAM-dependent methyltransferase
MGINPVKPDNDGNWNFYHPWDIYEYFTIAMARNFPRFQSTPPDNTAVFVQLGHGRKYIEGWTHIDYPEWNAETDPIPLADESVNVIATFHMLDHISDPRKVLRDAQRVLVDGGLFISIVPHYLGSTAYNCFDHKSRFSVDVWKNAMGNKYDPSQDNNGLEFNIGFNMIMGLSESDLVLVTQLIRKDRV